MKSLLAALAMAAAVVSTPALAQAWDPSVGSGNIVPPPYGRSLGTSRIPAYYGRGFNARAEAPYRHIRSHHRRHPATYR